MNNIKEAVKIGILVFLVVFFAIFFITTKGNDELNLNLDFMQGEEEFSYPVYASEYNGLYRNTDDNGIYAFVGKNADDTYRVYFIKTVRSVKTVIIKLDAVKLQSGKIVFTDTTNINVADAKMQITFSTNEMNVKPAQLGLSNEQLDGAYLKTKNISQFSMSEFQF